MEEVRHPQVPERAKRRSSTAMCKAEIVAEYDGDAISEIGLRALAAHDAADEDVNYLTAPLTGAR